MEEFRKQLIELVNDVSKRLPAEGVYYIFKDVYRDLCEDYKAYLQEVEKQKEIKEKTEEIKEG